MHVFPLPYLPSEGWLDDVGLPQYKDKFYESKVDGRMLQYLTVVRPKVASIPVLKISCNNYVQIRIFLPFRN